MPRLVLYRGVLGIETAFPSAGRAIRRTAMQCALEGTGRPAAFYELQHDTLVLLDTFALSLDLRVGDGRRDRLRSITGAGRERC